MILPSATYLLPSMMRQGAELRADLQRTSSELTTGISLDPGKKLRGDFSGLASIDSALSRIEAYASTTVAISVLADSMQSALSLISDASDQLSRRLLTTAGTGNAALLDITFGDGARFFDSAISALNTRVAGRSVFGGTQSDQPPLPDSATILSALETAVAAAVTPADLKTAIADWFTDPTGFAALYAGGPGRAAVPVAAGEAAALPFTALDPAIRNSLIGFATVALLDRGLLGQDPAGRVEMANFSAQSLLAAGDARQLLAARVGSTQQQVADAQSRNGAEKTALGIARLGLVAADPYESAVRLQDLQTKLDSFYTLTARLSKLRLTDYLR